MGIGRPADKSGMHGQIYPRIHRCIQLVQAMGEAKDVRAPGDIFAVYQGTKPDWPAVINRAGLPGITPLTPRHTLGSTAVSGGETLAMTGAILGHTNMRSTQIHAHVAADSAATATERVVGSLSAALDRRLSAKIAPIRRTGA